MHDLLASAGEIHAHVALQHMTEFGRRNYLELLSKREARLKGNGQVIELYQFAPVDENDPNEVSADREIDRIAREWARETKGKDK
ncbi:hypothetical protein IT084_01820 [Desulfallas sp. Bu1-1]|uniref:hypothetical protein n=1 Tax=Desulfallas sp. Bu1-1 TaxID=2787620 RepID=UPI00189C7B1B|nr:hypothetical protein [Desulfallas sp. Bu1-1]MBF7081719.1 hypothetical protein [Desulfallas sp. Bu1-1]